ncbi:hypothetical protein MBH78_17090 [Oceanimonas sp. NS1]|nr:hypothetical protein [Oceanimonas sp. NS1]
MTNPNNATITLVHRIRFVDGHGLTIPTFRLLKDDGHFYADAIAPELDKEQALAMYHSMVATRLLDERMLAAQRQGRISFTCRAWGGSPGGSQCGGAGTGRHDPGPVPGAGRPAAPGFYPGAIHEPAVFQ